ncbi:MAG: hypothetical protein IT374_09400 [Polyangiaceae bacterium]|nr:hypothetical protein [Polyangiaceae bacterium]
MRLARWIALSTLVAVGACDDAAPDGLRRTPPGEGPTVRFDVAHRPLPEIPFPNDVATYPDPTSRTGLRVNASLVAPTALEATARAKFSELEGWGTFAPLSVSFERAPGVDAAIDPGAVLARHRGDDYDFADDALYLIDLETGVPHPIDLGEGSFSFTLGDPSAYWKNDPLAGEPTLSWETRDEAGGDPGAAYAPELDTDFDGVLDRPNLDDPGACAGKTGADAERCKVDHLLTFYERESDTLVARPLVPLREKHGYAVVLTDRLRDAAGRPARSPFELVYHPSQEDGARRVQAALDDPAHAAYFGDLAGTGLAHVAFLWTFTTQPTTEDLALLRDGLYGRGPFARLSRDFSTDVQALPLIGYYTPAELAAGEIPDPSWPSFPQCDGRVGSNLVALPVSSLKQTLGDLSGIGFGLAPPEVDELVRSLDEISHIVVGRFQTPFFLPGGPEGKAPDASFQLDFSTGEGLVGRDDVMFYLFVPKHGAQPHPVTVFGHGYGGSSIQAIAYAGNFARQGVATVALDAAWHGFEIEPGLKKLIDIICQGVCAAPLADSLFAGRARDLDADGKIDPGGDLLTGYIFHTRDSIRQSIVDRVQLVRVLRSFGGAGQHDYDGDGAPELAGDFDADGRPDVGGPDVDISSWGQSLGGLLSTIHGGLDTELSAAAPSAPGGGLTDVIVRSNEREVVNASVLRTLGPLVVSVRARDLDAKSTRCAADELSLRFVMTSVNKDREIEFACVPRDDDRPMTVIAHNEANGERRCATVSPEGRFRVGVPATRDDYLTLTFLDGAHQVTSYAGCAPVPGATVRHFIERFGKGLDTTDACPAADGCLLFEGRRWAAGEYLRFPADGLGLRRGSPDLRRFLQLTQTALDAADPISFAPKYALSPLTDARTGGVAAARGLMVIAQAGDQTVPISTGVALGRAAGAVPFFRPDQAVRYPDWASYATPQALYDALGGRTPNRVLIDRHVIEGVAHLQRHPAGPACRANERPEAPSACRPACDASSGCFSGQSCDSKSPADSCTTRLSRATCDGALFDVDDLDDGAQPFDEQRLSVPLRVARRAAPAGPSELDRAWAPRLLGVPRRATDDGAWGADERVVAFTASYIKPDGQHAFYNPAPCQLWDNATYLANVAARFVATGGRDVYYLSHPATHGCLARGDCPP